MKLIFKKISEFLAYAFVAFLAFQINGLFWTESLYNSAFFNPYLSHFIYLGDIFLIGSFLFLVLDSVFSSENRIKIYDKKLLLLIILFLLIVGISLFNKINLWNSFFYFLRFLEFFGFYLLFVNGVFRLKTVLMVFMMSTFLNALIGIGQFFPQKSIGLGFLGEPVLNYKMLGVAKIELFGEKFLRSYGTFSHPNVFAAYLSMAILSGVFLLKKTGARKVRFFLYLVLVILCMSLLFSFSRSAILALTMVLVIYFWKSGVRKNLVFIGVGVLMVLAFVTINTIGFGERFLFFEISKNMFFENVFGVGIGNFTSVMQNFTIHELLPWNFQPVHNMYLLILNETGILGFFTFLALLIYLFFMVFRKVKDEGIKFLLLGVLGFLVIVGNFDHYLFSLYQGQALFWLVLGVIHCGIYRRGFL